MRVTATRLVIAATASFLASAQGLMASALPLGAASSYNAFVFNNFSEYNTDAEGAIAVGGNFTPLNGAGFTIASKHAGDGSGIWDLVVGGNFTNTYASMYGGDAWVGGNMNWTGPTLPHNAYVNGNFTNSAYGGSVGGTVYYAGSYSSNTTLAHTKVSSPTPPPIDFLGAQTSLNSLSVNLAAATQNGSVSSAYNTYTLTGSSSGLNVFNLSGSTYSGSTINISAPAGSTVVVNVAGAAASFSGGSINLSGVTAANVIFNFNAATTLNMGSIAFNGTILAPIATFNGNYGQLNGQLIVNNAAGTMELHDVLFRGDVPSNFYNTSSSTAQAPEPGTWLMIVGGVAMIAIVRRVRSK